MDQGRRRLEFYSPMPASAAGAAAKDSAAGAAAGATAPDTGAAAKDSAAGAADWRHGTRYRRRGQGQRGRRGSWRHGTRYRRRGQGQRGRRGSWRRGTRYRQRGQGQRGGGQLATTAPDTAPRPRTARPARRAGATAHRYRRRGQGQRGRRRQLAQQVPELTCKSRLSWGTGDPRALGKIPRCCGAEGLGRRGEAGHVGLEFGQLANPAAPGLYAAGKAAVEGDPKALGEGLGSAASAHPFVAPFVDAKTGVDELARSVAAGDKTGTILGIDHVGKGLGEMGLLAVTAGEIGEAVDVPQPVRSVPTFVRRRRRPDRRTGWLDRIRPAHLKH